jgi:hypothetical protein
LAAHFPTKGTAFQVCMLVGWDNLWSESLIAESSCLWSIIESRKTYWFPSGSHCVYIASAIKIAFNTVSSPPSNVNVYLHVLRIEDRVGVSQSDGVTIFVPLPGSDEALHQSPPLWDRNLCIEVVVPHLWGHLKVTVVRVKVMVIVINLAGNVRICVCWLHRSNDRHFCLSSTCQGLTHQQHSVMLANFEAIGSVRPATNTRSCMYVGISTIKVVTYSLPYVI